MQRYDLIIIGAGPAGLFAAISAASCNLSVLVLEKKENPGKKLLISGSGKCNFTHTGTPEELILHYYEGNRFVKPAIYAFDNKSLIEYFRKMGIPSVVTENGKVFPATFRASDVLNALVENTKRRGAKIRERCPVIGVKKSAEGFVVKTTTGIYESRTLLIATGGKSYPWTGSEGDGYLIAETLGHDIVNPEPALTPLFVEGFPLRNLSGLSFKSARVSLLRDGKKVIERTEPLLITHKGFSGPAILHLSRDAQRGDEILVNFLDVASEELENCLLDQKHKLVRRRLREFGYPLSLIDKAMQICKVLPKRKLSELPKAKRKCLIKTLTAYRERINKAGFQLAMVTKGGISLREVNPKTMESRKIRGLYFAGEVLNIDGETGGYNIQFAFSSAYLAVKAICHHLYSL
ncbi:hypothetical protein AT15_02155 [Kosmotoga arenicorallina S304]|uniref:Flavoprotein n=1 Tax=Kosmotoga arenicorallina S304 TaxID=1453497 RepID=A0A176JZ80_9BACT|nr:NAD(P)/FAD-dependent oxidoreductase [Kosmotoga arenicorallina]OAA29343.1 hypothetical protein AT15_02155 [Kosmotoga arenicorallina S304]